MSLRQNFIGVDVCLIDNYRLGPNIDAILV